MDRTLNPAARRNRRRSERNHGAWRRFCPDGHHCPYCRHDGSKHLMTSGQPHFYRPATAKERRNPSEALYRHDPPEGGSLLVKRVIVARDAEVITAFCRQCAEELSTRQALCFHRTLAVGEVVGIDADNDAA